MRVLKDNTHLTLNSIVLARLVRLRNTTGKNEKESANKHFFGKVQNVLRTATLDQCVTLLSYVRTYIR